jgi:hypothetical protein
LGKITLDSLKPVVPPSLSDLSFGSIFFSTPILVTQFLNTSDLSSETPYLFAKSPYVIHAVRISRFELSQRIRTSVEAD